MGTCIVSIFQYTSIKMQRYKVLYIWKLHYMFRVVLHPSSGAHTTVSTASVFLTPLLLSAAIVEELEPV
jgi:hypothetical protein